MSYVKSKTEDARHITYDKKNYNNIRRLILNLLALTSTYIRYSTLNCKESI